MGLKVQGWVADNGSENDREAHRTVKCLACRQLHLVNPVTGKVMGEDDND